MSNALQFSSAIIQDSRAICGSKRLLHESVAGSADDSRFVIQYDLHWHFLKQRLHPTFVQKRLHEDCILHLRHNLGSNAAANENASCGHEMQSAIPGLCSINTDENRQGPIADG